MAWLAYLVHIEVTKLRCQLGNTQPKPQHFSDLADFLPPNLHHWMGQRRKRGGDVGAFVAKIRDKYGDKSRNP